MKIRLKESVFYRTGQAWKFWVQAYGGLFCALFVVSGVWSGGMTPSVHNIFFILIGVFIGLSSFVFTSVSIRCPVCGDRWYWSAVSKKHETGGIDWFLSLKACPVCGETGKDADDKRAEGTRTHSP